MRRPEIIHTTLVNGEVVLLDLTARRYYSLNQTGARIWQLLEETTKIDAICEDLARRYEVTEDEASVLVVRLLDDLLSERLIKADDE